MLLLLGSVVAISLMLPGGPLRGLQPLSRHLRQWQSWRVAQVAGAAHVGLWALAVLLLSWADWRVPWRFIVGFRVLLDFVVIVVS